MYPIALPEKYDPASLATLSHRFSVVYLWDYLWNMSEFSGSHPWVDIRPVTPNQTVFAVLDGTVFKAWEDAAYWKYVFLEHNWVPDPDDFSKTTTLYSCYQHLDSIIVTTWEPVKEWQKIGTTGNTWISFWEHLHFQIDRKEAPFHAYWPYTGAEVRDLWIGFSQGVNIWLGKENAQKYTVNPLVYLDRIWWKNISNLVQETDSEKKEEGIILDINLFWDIENLILKDKEPTLFEEEHTASPVVKQENILSNKKDILLASVHNEREILSQEISIFHDVDPKHPLYNSIENFVKKWIFSWFWDNTFRPNLSISRIELLKMILLLKEIPLSSDENTYFQDIFSYSWHKKYVNTGKELWIVATQNTHFFPNEFITRVEALKMILTVFVWDIENKYTQSFSDVWETSWYAKYIQYAVENNLVSSQWKFFPNAFITRIEVVEIFSKLLKI